MSKIQEFIRDDIRKNPELKEQYEQVNLNLDASILVREMREDLGMTQKEFAKFVGKPQSTIGRIEAGSMNVSIGLINEIANAAHREVKLVLV
ncbi:helix-turn-helix domain-containing protein [Lactobacillus taiwanensis]|uniref:Transcriptional regulator n=1 Tax=Lactobacillus taiwanensis TaxID=508451 RepID=A0A256LEA6_9LACO|nr:helix-turn-helix transcriptional regulator [Lactobacillus taiwanensis]OYR88170.1 transcriptional regulator [Lactobacillus taiwanensis]OYR90319.1 transcriptional regulator [Lactobacillus taiwanensis]OYR91759.1 transcriptional regulator [Lactobacillus taiwanensis]OYR95487.1 transcriptional regulator [Lactobacillus taiwanensis]OYR96255.1 transcriptional regulator [Lactobacillus taiwanensis]